jgi:hypothetical protein
VCGIIGLTVLLGGGAPPPTPTALASSGDLQSAVGTSSPAFALLITKQGEDSLFVVNLSLDPFPLALLRVGDGEGAIRGENWGIATLGNGECVSTWNNSGTMQTPSVICTDVGARVFRDTANVFWRSPFNVYYGDVLVSTCDTAACVVRIRP